MSDGNLIELVTSKRAEQAKKEVRDKYPGATVSYEVSDSRGIITVVQDRCVVSREYVETESSLSSPHRMGEYARVLMGKSRLVLVVPRELVVKVRMKLLEFNNYWLFYYQLHYYNTDGEIRHMDRRTWRKMMDLPPDEEDRAPEIV